jgi:predicted amidohydrolase YtcJ
MGLRPGYHTPLENAYSIADVQETLAARRRDVPAGQFITTIGGFHPNQFRERRLPTRQELDEAVSDRPVYIQVAFNGPSTTNTLGRAFFESKGVTVGDDGSIAQGTPSGQALLALRQGQTFEDQQRSTLDALAYAAQVGVTTHLDQGAFPATNTASDGAAHADLYRMHAPLLALHRAGQVNLRIRINFLHLESDPELPQLKARLVNSFPFFGDDVVRTGGIGEFTANGLGDVWLAATRLVAQARWRNENHSLTRTDFQTITEGWERVNAEFPIADLRWVLAHVPFITEDYVNRLKVLGGGLSLTGWRYLAGTAQSSGPPFRMIVDNGIPVGMSSDGMQIAPMNPWLHMYYATTGVNARGDLINDGQQITRQEVLRLYTAANRWFIGEEDLGSIEPGKRADLVVLNKDFFTVRDEELKEIRSVLPIVGGQIVYDAGVL